MPPVTAAVIVEPLRDRPDKNLFVSVSTADISTVKSLKLPVLPNVIVPLLKDAEST